MALRLPEPSFSGVKDLIQFVSRATNYLNELVRSLRHNIQDLDTRLKIQEETGGIGSATWGSISGTLSSQTDLQAALNNKANLTHTHTAVQITDFSEAVDDRVSSLLVAGSGVTLTYNDVSNSLTISAGDEMPYDTLIDESGSFTYVGKAQAGSTESSASWRIYRIDESSSPDIEIRYADGVVTFNKIWDNRATYSY